MQNRLRSLIFFLLFTVTFCGTAPLCAQLLEPPVCPYSWIAPEGSAFDPASLESPDYMMTLIITFNLAVTLQTTPDCGNCNGAIYATASGGSVPYTYTWSNGSTTQVLNNLCAGTYTITVTDATGTTATASAFVAYASNVYSLTSTNHNICSIDSSGVTQPPSQACEKVCPGETVIYTLNGNNFPGGSNSAVIWTVTGATSWYAIAPGNQISVTWGNPGSGSVSYLIDGFCPGEGYQCVTIVDQPEARFSTNPGPSPVDISICKGQTVFFNNESHAATYFEWDFGDNSALSSSVSPQHQYNNPGTYWVRLIAQSACLCADTAYIKVTVLDAAALDLDCVGTVCSGTEVTYSAVGTCSQYIWSVSPNGTVVNGGTTTDPSITVQWNTGPEGTIGLLPFNCAQFNCPEPSIFEVPIIDDQAEIEGVARVCPSTTEMYTIEAFGGSNFVWTLSGGGTITSGQGTNRISVDWSDFPSNTNYLLSVQYDNCYLGCGGKDTLAVNILAPFIVDGPVERCDGADGAFNSFRTPGGALATNWSLIAPDGTTAWTSPVAAATTNISFMNGPGYYRIFATPANPALTCSDKAEWAVQVVEKPAKPTGIIGPTEICPGTVVTYSEAGAPHDYRTSWLVTNGPGASSTQTGNPLNINWTNVPGGPYKLALQHISTDGNNCPSDTVQLQIKPIGQFTLLGQTNICENQTGTYIAPNYENINVNWTISPANAGVIKSGQTTSVAEIYWVAAGTHTVTASICGQTASYSVTVFGTPNPVVTLPATGVCPGQTLNVQTTFPYSQFRWEQVSGSLLGTTPAISLGDGNYTLEVTDANGCKATETFFIDKYPEPNLTLSTLDPTGFCANSAFVKMRALTESDGLFTYEWLKDGAPLGHTLAEYTINQYGKYQVITTNGYGCTAISNEIEVFEDCTGMGGGGCPGGNCQACPPGAFSIQVTATARCDSFEFDLIPNTPLYLPGGCTWFFGLSGGSLLHQEVGNDHPTYVFPNAGQYIAGVQAKMTNGQVCFVYDSAIVAVKAQFDPVPVCPGEALQFEDESSLVPTRNIAGWAWNFDDPASGGNNTAAVAEPSHAFTTGGIYDVILTVTANTGCTSSVTVPLDIPHLPNPTFAPVDAPCPNNATELSLNPDATITHVSWNLGDPVSGAANTPEGGVVYHKFATLGTYNYNATATNNYGCTKTAYASVPIVPNPVSGNINPSFPAALCEGKTRTLIAPVGNVATWLWSTGETTSAITIGTEGTYRVTLTGNNGCTFVPPPVAQDIRPAPEAIIKALLTNDLGQVYGTAYPSLTVCQGEDVFLEITGAGTYNYVWSGGNGSGSTQEFSEVRGNLLNSGNYNYAVTVTDIISGCTDISDPFTVQVNPRPAPFALTTSGSLCDGSNTILSYNGAPPPATTQFLWSTGETTTAITVDEAGAYSLHLVNEFGCERTGEPAVVHPGPNISALPSGCLNRCRPDTLCIGNLFGISSWQWYFNGSPIPGATTADLIATQDGSYHAVLTDWLGCVKESDPLTLTLEDGFGTVNSNIWSDVNDNGIIDAGDTLMSGITVNLLQNGVSLGSAVANAGAVSFAGQPSGSTYQLVIDPLSLPSPDWEIVIDTAVVTLYGCDDIKNSGLLVRQQCLLPQTIQLSACEGKTIQYHGVSIPAGGSQTIQFGAGACDSLLTVNVLAMPNSTGAFAAQVCQGQTYNFNGINIAPGQNMQFVLANASGCDSVLTVSVSATPAPATSFQTRVCPNDVFVYEGISLAPGQSQQFTLQTAAGCDSLVTVSVAALPVSTGTENRQVCPGDFYTYQGVALAPGQSQQFVLSNFQGCDSIVTVNVTALPVSTGTESRQVCPGDVYVYQGISLVPGQTQQFTLQNYLGCDSLVTVSVSALPVSTATLQKYICPGDAFIYQGVSLVPGQSQQFILQNYLGCDSTVTVSVLAYASPGSTLNRQVCAGDAFVYQGVSLSPGQSQQFTLQNYLGCDSMVTVNVSAYNVAPSTVQAKACQGTSFIYQGTAIPAGQSQQFILQSYLGCDSMVTVNVATSPVYDQQQEVYICPRTTFTYNGIEMQPGETRIFHFTTLEVCDSAITISVKAHPDLVFDANALASCHNIDNGTISVSNTMGGSAPLEWSLDGVHFQSTPLWSGVAPGDYTVYAMDNYDCIFEGKTTVDEALPLEVLLPDAALPCDSSAVLITPVVGGNTAGGLQFLWSNGSNQPQVQYAETGPIWVEVTNQCETVRRESAVEWADAGKWDQVYVPNIFASEAESELNQLFRPFFVAGVDVYNYHFEIFDRWGNLVFRTDNLEEAWRGPMVDRMMQGAVFVWQVRADLAFCGRRLSVFYSGDVTLLR